MWNANGDFNKKIIEDLENEIKYFDLNLNEKNSIDKISEMIGYGAGAISFFATEKPPVGWLLCDGSKKKIKNYRRLYNVIKNTFQIYSLKADEFQLPNLSGIFIKSFDDRKQNWKDKNTHKLQQDTIKSHTHSVTSISENGNHNHTLNDKSHTHGYKDIYWSEVGGSVGNNLIGSSGGNDNDNKGYDISQNTNTKPDHNHSIVNDWDDHKHNITLSNEGKETVPKNKTLIVCIKY